MFSAELMLSVSAFPRVGSDWRRSCSGLCLDSGKSKYIWAWWLELSVLSCCHVNVSFLLVVLA